MLIDEQIEKIRRLDEDGKTDSAWALLDELLNEDPKNSRLWSLHGSLHRNSKNYVKAIESINKAIEFAPTQAIYNFQRGRYNFYLNNFLRAIDDFSETLIKDNYGDITFAQHVYFFRAETFIKLSRKEEALLDISNIPADFQTWTFALRTKNDLIADCNN